MAEGNGHSPDGMALPSEYQDFVIGKSVIKVPELTLYDLELAREPILALDGASWWADYAMNVCRIITILLPEQESSAEALFKRCSLKEARALSGSWAELLVKSGFDPVGEAEAAAAETQGTQSPGTGTSTQSSQSLGFGESVEETPGSSNEPSR